MNCLLIGAPIPKQIPRKEAVPESYKKIVDSYIEKCKITGNSEKTLELKYDYSRLFFIALMSTGCDSPCNISQESVMKATVSLTDKESWRFVKQLLRYMFETGITDNNYEALVPTLHKGYHLPHAYTKEELIMVEQAATSNNKNAKRDLSIIMLTTRYGIRSGDIRRLTFEDMNLTTDRLSFIQHKTHEPFDSELFQDVKDALLDYISNERPKSQSPIIFLSARAPYAPLSQGGIYTIVSNAFKKSGVDTIGKGLGPHAGRTSNSTLKVNGGMTYEETRQSIGWKDPSVMRHYIKIDVENLRKCALKPMPVDEESYFGKFLMGKVRI